MKNCRVVPLVRSFFNCLCTIIWYRLVVVSPQHLHKKTTNSHSTELGSLVWFHEMVSTQAIKARLNVFEAESTV